MKRIVVTPPVLASAALAELKLWLGITTHQDDDVLTAQLRAALEVCEAFTGAMPIEAFCEEVLPLSSEWQCLATRPVQAITLVQSIAADGARTNLAVGAYEVDLDAEGGGMVRIMLPGDAKRFAVRFTAGMAPGWSALPEAIRQGIMRLAAHQHRERETSGAAPLPPAAVAALWRPWRRVRLA